MLHLAQDSALPSPRSLSSSWLLMPDGEHNSAEEHDDDGAELEGSKPLLVGGGFGPRISGYSARAT